MHCIAYFLLASGIALTGVQDKPDDAIEHYMKATYYLQSERPMLALAELEEALALDPDSSELHIALAKIKLLLGRQDEALSALERAQELDPADAEVPQLIGRIHLQKAAGAVGAAESFERAEAAFKRALELNSEDRNSLFFLSLLYDHSGRVEEAVEAKRRLLSLDPGFRDVWLSLAGSLGSIGDAEGELAALKEALALEPNDVSLLRRVGEIADELGCEREAFEHFDRARVLLERQLRSLPHELNLHLQVGEICLRYTDQYDLALDHYEFVYQSARGNQSMVAQVADAVRGKAMAYFFMDDYEPSASTFDQFEQLLLSRSSGALGAMVIAYARTGRGEHALELLDRFTSSVSGNPDLEGFLNRLRASALGYMGRGEEADRLLERMIEANPADSDNYLRLGQVRLDRQDYRGAREALVRGLAEVGENDDLKFLLGVVLESSGDLAGARRTLSGLLEDNPDNHLALNYMGYALVDRTDRIEEGKALIERALAQRPYNGSYLDSLGWAYLKLGDLAKAEELLTRAVRTRYRSPEVREHIGHLYLALGRHSDALTEFRAAIANNLAERKSTLEVEEQIARLEAMLGER